MKNNRFMLSFFLLTAILLTTAPAVSVAQVYEPNVVFGCLASGKGLVWWGGLPDEIDPSPTLRGFVACGGSAIVDDLNDGSDGALSYEVHCGGVLVARWTIGDDRYKIMISFQSTEEASGAFFPEVNFFSLPIPEADLSLSYRGKLIINRNVEQISGLAGIGLSESGGTKFIIFVFELELEDGTPGLVTFQWIQDWARIFKHDVELLDA